jgi:sulfofructosephosphate aldolase
MSTPDGAVGRSSATTNLAPLARPSGAFAMLALDQRESLRTMLTPAFPAGVPDRALSEFKVEAARALAGAASAVLLDVAFGLESVRAAGGLPPRVGLIVAADRLTQEPGEPVESTEVDEDVLADDAIAAIADAYKLLVIWRSGQEADARRRTVESFLEGCARQGRPGIVEGIVRPAPGTELRPDEHADLVLEAAGELAGFGPALYKAEVPTLGAGTDSDVEGGARRVTEAIACPWVVLSNGTPPERFDSATLAACRGGASGFLAGRAIWIRSLDVPDRAAHLRNVAAPRLRQLATSVDAVARPWWEASR